MRAIYAMRAIVFETINIIAFSPPYNIYRNVLWRRCREYVLRHFLYAFSSCFGRILCSTDFNTIQVKVKKPLLSKLNEYENGEAKSLDNELNMYWFKVE